MLFLQFLKISDVGCLFLLQLLSDHIKLFPTWVLELRDKFSIFLVLGLHVFFILCLNIVHKLLIFDLQLCKGLFVRYLSLLQVGAVAYLKLFQWCLVIPLHFSSETIESLLKLLKVLGISRISLAQFISALSHLISELQLKIRDCTSVGIFLRFEVGGSLPLFLVLLFVDLLYLRQVLLIHFFDLFCMFCLVSLQLTNVLFIASCALILKLLQVDLMLFEFTVSFFDQSDFNNGEAFLQLL